MTPAGQYDEYGPTYWEGYWARVVGWRLHKDATESYRRGWMAADRLRQE